MTERDPRWEGVTGGVTFPVRLWAVGTRTPCLLCLPRPALRVVS